MSSYDPSQGPPPGGYRPPAGYPPPGAYPPAGAYPPPSGCPPPGGYPPASGGHLPTTAPPENYLVLAILTTLFCCVPFGVLSIIHAAQVNSKWGIGDYAGSREASDKAKRWAIIAAATGAVVAAAMVVLYLLIVGGVLSIAYFGFLNDWR